LPRRELTEGLMRPHRVVAEFLGKEDLAQLGQGVSWAEHLVELLFVDAPGSFDAAAEFG
jgi:hypothetical protein